MKRARATRDDQRLTKKAKKPKAEKRGRSDDVPGRAAETATESNTKRGQSDDARVRLIQGQAKRGQSDDARVTLIRGPGRRLSRMDALKVAKTQLESMQGLGLVPQPGICTSQDAPPRRPTLGSDCSGLGTERYALKLAGIHVISKFASEINCRAQQLYQAVHRDDVHDRVMHKDVCDPSLLREQVDLYVAGPPCQSWSTMGKRQGLDDLKGRGITFFHCLQYVMKKRPKAVVFENVIGLKKHFAMEFLDILLILKDQCNYAVTWEVLNSRDHGVPQPRQRIYIVAIARETLKRKFTFPKKLRMTPGIEKFLKDDIPELKRLPPHMAETAQKNINAQTEKLKKAGVDIDRQTCLIDVHASPQFGQAAVGISPCITATRGKQGGFFVTNRQRMTNIEELGRLQGWPTQVVHKMQRDNVRVAKKYIGHAIGNGMTVNVVLRLLPRVLYSAGLLAEKPFDQWKHANFKTYKTLPDDMYQGIPL